MPRLRLPAGAKVFGGFISVRPNGSTYNTWANLWDSNFSLAYFSAQADQVKSIGGNAVAIGGDVGWYVAGGMTQAQYLEKRRQVAEMLRNKGMYFIAYGASGFHNWGGGVNFPTGATSIAQGAAIIAADAAMLSQFPNCIGCVGVDEPWAIWTGENFIGAVTPVSAATLSGWLSTIYSAMKAAVPDDFPVAACSNPNGDGQNFSPSNTPMVNSAAYCDFFSMHLFYGPGARASTSALSSMRTAYPNVDFVFPSGGAPLSYGSSEITAQITANMTVMNQQRGGMIWCVNDYVDDTGADPNRWGLFSPAGAARTAATTPFTSALPATLHPLRSIRRYPGKPRRTALSQWGF